MKNKYTHQEIPNQKKFDNNKFKHYNNFGLEPFATIHPMVSLRLHLNKMKEILTPDEYDRYLDALLPPSPGEQTNEN